MHDLMRWILLIPVVILAALAVWTGWFLWQPLPVDCPVSVLIPAGGGLSDIQDILMEHGIVPRDYRFAATAWLSGSSRKLRAGEYLVEPGMTPLDLLDNMVAGRVIRHHLTIPEGLTMKQIADRFAEAGWIDRQRFLALASDAGFIRRLGLQVDRLEGYLFPDTYTLVRGETSESMIISMMVRRFLQVWQEISRQEHPPEGLNRHELVTLASLVEKETGQADERPRVARVFLNRIKRGMRLQSDPTVVYDLPDFDGTIRRQDLRRHSPYNTYRIIGLPPGPICSPGRAALEAVLHPARSDALYFVARRDGTHQFSTTLKEHNRAVQRYQRMPIRSHNGN